MTRFFPTLLLSFFLFFQTSALADENTTASEIAAEEIEGGTEESHADAQTEVTETEQEKEELSELEKEALAAEEAELRESGIYEEPIEE